jgi:hypothetical protein
MPIEDIVNVTVTTDSVRVSQTGFGTPLIAAFHDNWDDDARVREYSAATALSALIDEGFETTDPAYNAMRLILSQNPRPRTVKIGRRDTDWTQIIRLVPGTPAEGDKYQVEVDGTAVFATADSDPTVAEICTDLAAAINGIADNTFSADGSSGTHVDITSDDPCVLHTVKYVVDALRNFSIADVTTDGGIQADLNLIRAADSDFYGLVIDSNATAEIMEAAEWAEAQKVVFCYHTSDTEVLAATGLFSDLKDLGYARSIGLYTESQDSFGGAGWLGVMLPFAPGAATWAFKTIAGLAVSKLSSTQVSNIKSKNGNSYTSVGGVSITRDGVSASGEFADITVFVDWVIARISERVFALIASRPKLGYTDQSVDLVRGEIEAQLAQGVAVGGLVAGTTSVDAPLVASVSATDRANRLLPDVTFSGRLAGAIHAINIAGNLSI